VTYIQVESSTDLPTANTLREISGGGSLRLNANWSVSGSIVRDLSASDDQTRGLSFRIAYQDECFVFATDLSRRNTVNGTLRPDTTLLFRLYFKYLGEIDTRGPSLGQ
jgi:LPS-assembly protein